MNIIWLMLILSPLRAEESPLEKAAAALRASREDLSTHPGRWPTRWTMPEIENAMEDPLSVPGSIESWGSSLAAARSLSSQLELAGSLIGAGKQTLEPGGSIPPGSLPKELPLGLRGPMAEILSAVAQAGAVLSRALENLPAPDRLRLEQSFRASLMHAGFERPAPEAFALAERWDPASAVLAAQVLSRSIEKHFEVFRKAKAPAGLRLRWQSPAGDVLVRGAGDDAYEAEDLRKAALIVDLGGKNRHAGPAAAAGPGEVRVILDFGSDVVVESSASAASGLFGIGLLYLPNPEGEKRLAAGPFSLGAGLFGAGGALARGERLEFSSGDFSQGAGAFGAGVLDAEASRSTFSASYAAQGHGSSRGAGIFHHRGGGARLDCGLEYPDPHESAASIGFCQGTGRGPRAFAAGGFGLARVEGEGARLSSGYFAQGSGYWHGLGALWIVGNGNRLQARRYAQGAGVHTAVGALRLEGDGNAVLNWGVGPAYGWDNGVGVLDALGSGNTFYAQWSSGRGDVNGVALTRIRGDGNLLILPEFASGVMKRGEPSWGLAEIQGRDNRLGHSAEFSSAPVFQSTPWGALVSDGGWSADAGASFPAPSWRSLDAEREEAALRERMKSWRKLAEAEAGGDKVRGWLALASGGDLDGHIPRQAVLRLLGLGEPGVFELASLLSPEGFDEFIWWRILLAAYDSSAALYRQWEGSAGLRRALVTGQFAYAPAREGLKIATLARKDPEPRVRRAAAALLGALFDRAGGEEPGRLSFLKQLLAACGKPWREDAFRRFGRKYLADLYGALSVAGVPNADDRRAIMNRIANPFDPATPDAFLELGKILNGKPQACTAIAAEIKESEGLIEEARALLHELIRDPEPDIEESALLALGKIGDARDASRVALGLEHPKAVLREAAALALGKMGLAAESAIRRAGESPEPRTRSLAALAAAQSYEGAVYDLAARGLSDPDPFVRRTAIAAMGAAAQEPIRPRFKNFKEEVSRLRGDPDASVRATAAVHAF